MNAPSISNETEHRSKSARRLALVLCGMGAFDTLALVAVAMPHEWLGLLHRWAGLGAIPEGPIVGYLARSASALYALHGAIVVFISFDVARYERLIRFMALAALIHGAVILGIDLVENLPPLWRFAEGPCFSATGAVVLWLLDCMERDRARDGSIATSAGGRQPSPATANRNVDQPQAS
jgi:hypothetical protein